MQNIYSMASSSASTTYGNVMAFIKELILEYLPPVEWKDVNLASEIASVNVRRRLGRNRIIEISKLERPNVNITPRLESPPDDMFLNKVPLTENLNNIEYGVALSTLFYILRNDTDGYSLNYKLNRDRITFDIEINVDSMIQQIDLQKYLQNWMTWERPYLVTTSLEAMIPRKLVKHMGLLSNIDIDNKNSNQIPIILQTMNRYSKYPITYKMRNGTAHDEFFLYYTTNVLVNFYDLQMESVNRKNFADDFYQVRFSCTAEFNLPGLFALIGTPPIPKIIIDDFRVIEKDLDHELIPMFTVDNFFARYPEQRDGFIRFGSARFKTDASNKNMIADTVNFEPLFDDLTKNAIRMYEKESFGSPMDLVVKVYVLKDGKELPQNMYKIYWNRFEIEVYDPDDRSTYVLIIYINNTKLSETKTDIIESSRIDKPKL